MPHLINKLNFKFYLIYFNFNSNSHMQLKCTDVGPGIKTPGDAVGRGEDQGSDHLHGVPSELEKKINLLLPHGDVFVTVDKLKNVATKHCRHILSGC